MKRSILLLALAAASCAFGADLKPVDEGGYAKLVAASKGKANPAQVNALLRKKLGA